MLCLVTGQKQQESPVPFCHPYQVPSYLRACHSLSRRIAASRLKPSSSSSSSDTPRSPFNFTWYVKAGSNGDRRPPILRGRSQLLARWQETQELGTRSLKGCRVTWKEKKQPRSVRFGGATTDLHARPRCSPHLQATASALQRSRSPLRPISEASSALGPPLCPQTANQTPRWTVTAVHSLVLRQRRCHGFPERLPLGGGWRVVTSAVMAVVCGRGLLAPLGGRLLAGPRAPLRSVTAAAAAPLYDVVVSGGGMVGSAMAAALGKAVTFSASQVPSARPGAFAVPAPAGAAVTASQPVAVFPSCPCRGGGRSRRPVGLPHCVL